MRGKNISWRHLQQLYDAKLAMSSRSSGLYLIQKLKQEHVNLTSFSRMRVDLAAEVSAYTSLPVKLLCNYMHVFILQVLSQSITNALEFYGGAETSETKTFVQTFDQFF